MNSNLRLPTRASLSSADEEPHTDRNGHSESENGIHAEPDPREKAVENPYVVPPVDPFKPSSGSVELDPARLATELRTENSRLQQLLDQARKRLMQAEQTAEQWKTREQVYENLLEEKSELIRDLHQQVSELKQQPHTPAEGGQTGPNEEELIALHHELDRERQQLKEDEDALMQQMRTMEVQMATERALLARQRSELQRLQTELKHQLELASRDAALRERLAPLYRLQEAAPSAQQPAPLAQHAPPQAQPQQSSGFFRRMFGRDK
jgi:hypothetical protein